MASNGLKNATKDEKMLGTQCCCLVAMVTTAYYPALSFIKKELHLTEEEENACSLQNRRGKKGVIIRVLEQLPKHKWNFNSPWKS